MFAADGVSVTMEAIRKKAGISNGSTRHLFPNREALACALFKEVYEERVERMIAVLRQHQDDPATGVVALLQGEVRFATERPLRARVQQMLNAMAWTAQVAPEIATWRQEQDSRVWRSVPDLRNKVDPAVPLAALTSAIEGCAARLVASVLDGAAPAEMDEIVLATGKGLCKGFGLSDIAPTGPDHSGGTRRRPRPAPKPAPSQGPDLFGESVSTPEPTN